MRELRYNLPSDLAARVQQAVDTWQNEGRIAKLWARDKSLWTNSDEDKWLGWMDIVERADVPALKALQQEVADAGFEYALLLGMGGSSLCPEVLSKTFGPIAGHPKLGIVDSTDPAQVLAAEKSVKLKKTLCVVSSKSGSTLEPNILKQYFFTRMAEEAGNAGPHFIAVTDPGSQMEKVAKQDGFRHIFYGDPSIGGRYSALSNFGLVPAAIIGIDLDRFLAETKVAIASCQTTASVERNPGVMLGLILGTAAVHGRDKITFFTSKEIGDLGAWFEQLIAESTGKQGKGITPVDREPIGPPEVYGDDRVFAYVKLASSSDKKLDDAVDALEAAGQPVVRFVLDDIYEVGQQFFTWEIATAVAGSVLGIDAFNQPDVEASKIETRKLTSEYEETGKLDEKSPILVDGDISVFANRTYAARLHGAGGTGSLRAILAAHLNQLNPGDYFAMLAYIEHNQRNEEALTVPRTQVRDIRKVATCLGFGPRFLHSTGQDYKGGPNTGVFLQITSDHERDLQVPGAKYTFGVVIAAQAAGDLAVLEQRGRRALRVHLGKNPANGLRKLNWAIADALGVTI